MRILHVTKKYPNALGGDAIVVQNLEKQQRKNGHEVFILTTNCDKIIDKRNIIKFGLKDTSQGLDNITLRRIFSLIDLRIKFPKILKKIRPNIVHCHSIDMGFIISKVCKKNNIPLIQHMHCGLFTNKSSDKKRAILEEFFIKNSDFINIISVNPNDEKKLKNLVFIPNGIDLTIFKKSKKKKSNKINILFVGRVEKSKGLTYLIKSLKKLEKKNNKIILNILGEGSDLDYYKNLVKKDKINKHIKFLGKKPQKDLIIDYKNSDIFVLPSVKTEGFGLVLLEAIRSNGMQNSCCCYKYCWGC